MFRDSGVYFIGFIEGELIIGRIQFFMGSFMRDFVCFWLLDIYCYQFSGSCLFLLGLCVVSVGGGNFFKDGRYSFEIVSF